MNKNRIARWTLLAVGLVAIIALTGMNVYSLYTLRNTMVDTDRERKNLQLEEVASKIRGSMYEPFWGLGKISLARVENIQSNEQSFPQNFKNVLKNAAESGFFSEVFYTREDINPCDDVRIYQYSPSSDELNLTSNYNDLVCDGVGLARTRANIALDDIEYRWNTSVAFDTHRSMNIALIDIERDRNIIGYLTFIVDQEYLVNDYIEPLLIETFGSEENSGVAVWLYYWVQDEVLATNASDLVYDSKLVDYSQNFSNFLENWNLKIRYNTTSSATVYNASLRKNLIVLAAAVFLLIGALIFMFSTAQKERQLAIRQAGFLANVTHELKTPLAVMQAAGENIADGRVTEAHRLKQYGDHIYNEAVRLRKMIESLLDVAKADAGQSFVQPTVQQLDELLQKFVDENASYLKQNDVEFTIKMDKEIPPVFIDPDSVETILRNLIENGIKYGSEEKKIEFNLKKFPSQLDVIVRDNGIGINKKDQKHIFDKFYRVEDTLTATTKGHGLGLSIVKNHVDLNGGSIKLESEPGKGSTFIVSFPVLNSEELKKVEEAASKAHQIQSNNIEYAG